MEQHASRVRKDGEPTAEQPAERITVVKRRADSPVLLESIADLRTRLPTELKDQQAFVRPILRAVNDADLKNAIRDLRDNILRSTIQHGRHDNGLIIALAGVNGREGTSWLSFMLALSLGSFVHRKIAFLDGHFNNERFRAIRKIFNLSRSELPLRNGDESFTVYSNGAQPNIYFLVNEEVDHGLEFFSDKKLAPFLDEVRDNFDFTVIDMPPLLKDSSNVFLAPCVDDLYLVAAAGKTSMADVSRCVEAIKVEGAEISGVVLNKQKIPLWSRLFWKKYFV